MPSFPFAPGALRVDLLHTVDEALADWQQLELTGHCSAFQTRAWLLPLYRLLAPRLGLEPCLLRVRAWPDGRPLLLWPLLLRPRHGLRLLESADLGVADFNAPLLAAGWPAGPLAAAPAWRRVWQAACRALHTLPGGAALLRLEKLPLRIGAVPHPLWADAAVATSAVEDGDAAEAAADALQPTNVAAATEATNAADAAAAADAHLARAACAAGAEAMDFGTWAMALPRQPADFSRQCLGASFAKDLAMRQRRLARKGAVRFALATTPAEREAAFAVLVRQRARRFAETGREDILGHPDFQRYYAEAAVHAPGEVVRLFTLHAGEVPVAVLLALDHGGARHVVMPTFEAGEWKNCSPGNLLLLAAIEHAIAGGLRRFDFTIGDEAYKAGFGARREPVWQRWQPLSAPGWLLAGARGGARGLRGWWRGLQPPPAAHLSLHDDPRA